MEANFLLEENNLLVRIAARDQEAFSIVYEKYHRKIYTFALKLLKSSLLAEEIVQESFLKIWLMGEELTNVQNIEPYLRTLARNRALDLIRRQDRLLKAERSSTANWSEDDNTTEESIILQDTKQLLAQGIELLPAQQKIVYQLCHQEGLKYEEVAKQLNLSPLTVKTHMQHALRFLRKYITNNTDVAIALIILRLL